MRVPFLPSAGLDRLKEWATGPWTAADGGVAVRDVGKDGKKDFTAAFCASNNTGVLSCYRNGSRWTTYLMDADRMYPVYTEPAAATGEEAVVAKKFAIVK